LKENYWGEQVKPLNGSTLLVADTGSAKPVFGKEEIMKKKGNGTCEVEPQSNLKYGADFKTANNIGCKNRFFAEFSGYSFQPDKSSWIEAV